MGFRQADSEGRGGYARIWSVDKKDKYTTGKCSTSHKVKDGGYETDFQDGYVRFIGKAHEKISSVHSIPEKGLPIQITSCEVKTPYNAETKKSYTNYIIYDFELQDGNGSNQNQSKAAPQKTKPSVNVAADDDLPF